ncbi:MAG: domain S-box protein [Verrucomicrobiales bacterium]|nr:domain S-box protein [Verrucomicrobiales bacterium]
MSRHQALPVKYTRSGIFSGLCGILCAALGVAVMVGWHMGNGFPVCIQEDFSPIEYISALCFLLSGMSLVFFTFNRGRFFIIGSGVLTGSIGLMLSLEYLAGQKPLLTAVLPWLPRIPGLLTTCPSPPTAAGLAFAGIGVLFLGLQIKANTKRLLIWIAGTSVAAVGMMALCGYKLGVRMIFVSGDSMGMALHGAFAVTVLGLGLLAAQWARPHRLWDDHWLPIPLGMGGVVAALMLWQALMVDRTHVMREQAQVIAENVSADVIRRFTLALRGLTRIKVNWERSGTAGAYPEWETDAENYLRDEPVFECIGRTDADWKVTLVQLDADAQPLIGRDFHQSPWGADDTWRKVIDHPMEILITPTTKIRGDDIGFYVFLPMYSAKQFTGFVFAGFRLMDLKTSTLDQKAFATCRISLFRENKYVLGDPPMQPAGTRNHGESEIRFNKGTWKFVVEPRSSELAGGKLPGLILWLGILLAVAGSAATWSFQRSVQRTWMALNANQQMKEEISEREAAERSLKETAELLRQRNIELEAATAEARAHAKAKTEFLANMSHEIRTPMNAVLGMSEILMHARLGSREREFVGTIHSSGQVLLSLINDILDLSKIESGQLELENVPVPLRECVESVMDLLAGQAQRKGLELMAWTDPALPEAVFGDPMRLRQVFLNLVSNAVKFTEKGEIIIRLSLRHDGDNAPWLHAAVRDTGIGIPPEGMDRLFGMFSQVDASTTRRFGGTGLGLAISQRLVQSMGGRIWAESGPGGGSTFQFEIPLRPAGHDSPADPATAVLHGHRVLIADDNEEHRSILSGQLQSWRMTATAAGGGPQALERIRAGEKFDLAVIDADMPEMDGWTLAAEIRRLSPEVPPRLILLIPREGTHRDTAALEISAVLHKPVKTAALLRALQQALTGESPVSGPTAFSLAAGGAEPDAGVRNQSVETVPAPAPSTAQPQDIGEAKAGHQTATSSSGTGTGIVRILVAEDNLVNQRVVSLHLRRMGYECTLVSNGLETLRAMEEVRFDILLLDIQMPEMDGLETAREICRRYCADSRPWIIALTANAFGSDRDACLAAGMNDFLSKPVQGETLRQALQAAFDGKLPCISEGI